MGKISKRVPHPAGGNAWLQLLSLFFLSLAGCTTPVSENLAGRLPDGLYHFEAKPAVAPQYAQVTWGSAGWKLELLGDGGGEFVLRPGSDGQLEIINDSMNYPGLKRTLNGKGQLQPDQRASGQLEIWLNGIGPVKRNHRKAEWQLRPATPAERTRWERRQKVLEKRKQRARDAGLEIKEP